MPPSRKRKRPARDRAPKSPARTTKDSVRRDERVSREAVDALVSSLRPDQPPPSWRTHPANLTEFCAALVVLGAPAVHDRDELVGFRVKLKAPE